MPALLKCRACSSSLGASRQALCSLPLLPLHAVAAGCIRLLYAGDYPPILCGCLMLESPCCRPPSASIWLGS